MVFRTNMRVRLTQNIDKDRGFVNGTIGHVVHVLRKDVFVLRSQQGVLILVHPIWRDGRAFMACTYAHVSFDCK